MIAKDVKTLLETVAKRCSLERYTWAVVIAESAPPEDDDRFPADVAAHVDVYGLHAEVTIYPAFYEQDFPDRVSNVLHEVAHVLLHEYASAAQGFAGDCQEALRQSEERTCDMVGRLIASSCREAGVDFGVLM